MQPPRQARSMRHLAGLTRHELNELRALRARHGVHGALAARVRKHLDLEAVSGPWVNAAESRLGRLDQVPGEDPALAGLRDRLSRLEAAAERERELGAIMAMTAFVDALPPQELKVSVVITTRGRPEGLRTALESVLAQTHRRWEAVVALDGDDEQTVAVAASFEDPRIVTVDRSGIARGAALNLALGSATGEVVAYLDDDNSMQRQWLAAVAWVFGDDPLVEVAYGALARQPEEGGMPAIAFHPWDPLALERNNVTDHNAIAHRRDLPEARFDEELPRMHDWELLTRLTATSTPKRIPVLAAAYRIGAPGRMSDMDGRRETADRIRRAVARRRPLRVLASNLMFPLISETYIADELESLVDNGAEIAYHREGPALAPMHVPRPVYDDFDLALAEFRPDVVLMHWATYAESQLPRMEACGLPFGVRVHSFDHGDERVRALLAHPQCVGVWSYPSAVYGIAGTHPLPPVFTSVRDMPPPAPVRDAVVSISAGLPKKDWPLLFDAFGRLGGLRRHVVTGVTHGHTDVPGELALRAEAMSDPPLLQVNLTRAEAHALLARTSVLVYTLAPGVRFGMPMSVVEALCAGCCVVLPDRPECRDYAGPGFRGYLDAADIARHVREVMRGGPEIEAERAANLAYGRERFCDPRLGAGFHAQLREGVDRFRYGWVDAGLSAATSLA